MPSILIVLVILALSKLPHHCLNALEETGQRSTHTKRHRGHRARVTTGRAEGKFRLFEPCTYASCGAYYEEAAAEYFFSQFSITAKMVLWVFGYGSLIWRTGFNYDERVIGFVKDYRRVFHQGSVDHRGTIEQPGRTVTLEQHKGAITWGAAFRVSGHDEEKIVMAYLDVREQAYDLKALLDFYTVDSPDKPAISGVLTYIATSSPANKSYLGPATLEAMARQIATSHGPSGPNHEYLFRLEEALHEIGVECVDPYLVELANEVREVLASLNPTFNGKVVTGLNGQHLTNQSNQLGSPRHPRIMVHS